jgi:flagellar basal-body rod protein FlgG
VETSDGHPYLDPEHKIIKVSPQSTVSVNRDGAFTVDGVVTNTRLLVVGFQNPKGLEKEGQLLLRPRTEAGKAQEITADLEPGALEQSNASAVQSMTGLVTASRSFDMMTRVIDAFSAADKLAAKDIMGSG